VCLHSKVTQFRTTARPLKLGQIYCPETSVNKYQTISRNFPEERASEVEFFHDKPAYVRLISYWTNQEVLWPSGTRNSMTGLQSRHLKPVKSIPTTNIFSYVLSSRSCPYPFDYQRQICHTFLIFKVITCPGNDIPVYLIILSH
jgi:hypothetical protein